MNTKVALQQGHERRFSDIVFHFDRLKFMELISSVSQNVLFLSITGLKQIKGLANCWRE